MDRPRTSDSTLDIPAPDVAPIRRVLIEKHKAERDIGRVLECPQRDLGWVRRVQPKERIDNSDLVMFCSISHDTPHTLVLISYVRRKNRSEIRDGWAGTTSVPGLISALSPRPEPGPRPISVDWTYGSSGNVVFARSELVR
jgi:hypothetical protein